MYNQPKQNQQPIYNQNQQPNYNQNQQPYQFQQNNQFQQYRPNLQVLNKGFGIDQNEYNTISNSWINAYLNKQHPLSSNASAAIKNAIGGEWFVCSNPSDKKDFDFSLTSAKAEDSLIFTVDSILFQVCRLK